MGQSDKRSGRASVAKRAAGKVKREIGGRLKNLPYRLRGAPDHLPIPPQKLISLVAGVSDVPLFLEYGRRGAESTLGILDRNGVNISDLRAILDFGCGCGRVIRHFKSLGPQLYGSDYNPALIDWCRRNLPFAEFEVNGLTPPLPYADSTFDFVYTLSIFTHLSEALQFQWIRELSRILKPRGYLLITTHGEYYLTHNQMRPEEQEKFKSGQLAVRNDELSGANTCSTFHPFTYLRDHLGKGFDIIDFVPEGAKGNPYQDASLLRKA